VKFLIDTHVFSALLLPAVDAALLTRYRERRSDLATASLVVHELRYGADLLPARSRRRLAILDFIRTQVQTIPVLPYDAGAAEWHGAERARLRKRGETPPFVDGQIAAIAAVNGLTVVTDSTRDFGIFRGLRTERW
jgi:tRNA(fMet)-specific endonuclease VapC